VWNEAKGGGGYEFRGRKASGGLSWIRRPCHHHVLVRCTHILVCTFADTHL
jgi:hypothetical protein